MISRLTNTSKTFLLFLCFIPFYGLILAYYSSSAQISGDDAFSIFYAQQPLANLLDQLSQEANPPLYFTLLHYWISIFGISPFAVQSLSFLFSFLALFLLIRLCITHTNWLTALLAGILFIISRIHIEFAFEIRAFALVSCLSLLSLNAFLDYIIKGGKISLVLLSISNAALVYAHYNSALVGITEFIFSFVLFRSDFKKWRPLVLSLIVSATLFLPHFFTFFRNIPDSSFWLSIPTLKDLVFVLIKITGFDLPAVCIHLIMGIGLLTLFFSGLRTRLFKSEYDFRLFLLFFLMAYLPIFLCYGLAQFTPVFRVRYLIFCSPPLLIGISYLLTSLQFKYIRWISSASLLLIILKTYPNEKLYNERWEETATEVQLLKTDSTLVFINAPYKYRDFLYYYDRALFNDYTNGLNKLQQTGVYPVSSIEIIDSYLSRHKANNILLIRSHHVVSDPENLLPKHLEQLGWKKVKQSGNEVSTVILHFIKTEN